MHAKCKPRSYKPLRGRVLVQIGFIRSAPQGAVPGAVGSGVYIFN